MIRALIIFCLIVVIPATATGESQGPAEASRAPIDISADHLVVDEQQGTAIFSGGVVVKQEDMTIYAEQLTLHRDQQNQQIARIDASGGVKVVQLDRVGTAREARYDQLEETLVLIGDATLRQGPNSVSGAEIILDLKQNRSLVKSGEDGRVRAVFFPEQGQEQD